MENELAYLKMDYERKEKLIMAKKKIHQELKAKVEQFKELISKNMKPKMPKNQSSRIQFPMIVLCRK